MTFRLALTVAEIAVVVAALAFFLVLLGRQLRGVARTLGTIAFGVRAVESQTARIGPAVTQLNEVLAEIAEGFQEASTRAEDLG